MTEQLFEECIVRILEGDQVGLKQIYEAYLSYVYTIVYQMLQNKEDAEDVTSDFFLRIWYTADKFKRGHGHKAYLATIARNMCIDYLRKHKREVPVDLSGADESNENTAYQNNRQENNQTGLQTAAQIMEGFETEVVSDMTLRDALATLSPGMREIIHLKISGDLTFREISEVLRVPMGTVTSRYRDAIKKLRRCGFYEESG